MPPSPATCLVTLIACGACVLCACHKGTAAPGPSFVVSVSMPGASASDAEGLASVIERSCGQVPKVARLVGTAREGVASVRVEMERGSDVDADAMALTEALKSARTSLPIEAPPPVLSRGTGAVVVRHALRSEVLPLREVTVTEQALWAMPASRTAGVGSTQECGQFAPRVLVDVDAPALAAMGMTLPDVAAALRKGSVGPATAMTPLLLATRNGAPVRLNDVARVSDDAATPRCRAFDEKGPVVEVTVRGQPGAEPAKVRDALAVTQREALAAMPMGMTMTAVAPGRTVEVDLDPSQVSLRIPEALREAVAEVPGVGAFVLEVGPSAETDLPSWAHVRLASEDEALAARVASALAALPFVRGAGEPDATVELVGADRAALEASADAMRTAVGAHARIVQRLGGDRELVTRVVVDPTRTKQLGVSAADVALVVQARDGVTVGSYFDVHSVAVPVVMRCKGAPDQLFVHGAQGSVPLSAVAATKTEQVEGVLLHEGQFPMIGARVQAGDTKALEKVFLAPQGMQYRVMPAW
jgi:multidrug efflux pump subunit AcrB